MGDIDEVAENIYLIDDHVYSIPQWGGVYLINEEKKALIDSGPANSANIILDGVRKVGVRPEDIDYIVVTHVHLDHAGGAGVLVRDMPRAQVVTHHKGSKHLVNPAKLVGSIIEARGEGAIAMCGDIVPIERDRVRPVYDGDVIRLSEKQILRFIDAPGHAPHELCIYESRNNGLFVGDAVGVYVHEDGGVLMPGTPPPSFDLEQYIDTLERLMELNVTMIYFAHFGVTDKVQENLQIAIDKLKVWGDMVATAMKENRVDSVGERMIAQACAELEPVREMAPQYKHVTEVLVPMNIAGFIKYYQDKHKAELDKRRQGESNQG